MSFEVIDRRGGNKVVEETPKPVLVEAAKEKPAKGKWKDTDTVIAVNPTADGGIIVSGQLAGLREDRAPFTASYLFAPRWKDNPNWEEVLRKRLDTFLDCDCTRDGPCATHKMLLPQWITQDKQRLALAASVPLPEVLEVIMRAEMAKQKSRIAVPR